MKQLESLIVLHPVHATGREQRGDGPHDHVGRQPVQLVRRRLSIKAVPVISCYGPESAASSVEGTLDSPFPVVPTRRPDDAWQYQRTRELTMFTYASFTAVGTHRLTVTDNTADGIAAPALRRLAPMHGRPRPRRRVRAHSR